VSNPHQPKSSWPPTEVVGQGQDPIQDALMSPTQEAEHVQSRFSNLQLPGEAGGQPEADPASHSSSHGTVSVHQRPKERIETFLPSTEGGPWRVAAVLRLGAAGFGLMTAALFVMPALNGSIQLPLAPETESLVTASYKTIAPTFGTPEPSEDPEEVITEQSTAFDGAAVLVVESEPTNVSVRVDGNDQGNTPVSLTLDCLPGKPIKIEVSRKGYERAQKITFCRMDTMVKLYARLKKSEKKPGAPK
jgi:PEGA domain